MGCVSSQPDSSSPVSSVRPEKKRTSSSPKSSGPNPNSNQNGGGVGSVVAVASASSLPSKLDDSHPLVLDQHRRSIGDHESGLDSPRLHHDDLPASAVMSPHATTAATVGAATVKSSIETTVVVQPNDIESLYPIHHHLHHHHHPHLSLTHPQFPSPSNFDIRVQFVHANELSTIEVNQLDAGMKIQQFRSRVLAAHRDAMNEMGVIENDDRGGIKVKPKVLMIHRGRIMKDDDTLATYSINGATCDQEQVLLLFSKSPPFNPDIKLW